MRFIFLKILQVNTLGLPRIVNTCRPTRKNILTLPLQEACQHIIVWNGLIGQFKVYEAFQFITTDFPTFPASEGPQLYLVWQNLRQ